MLHECRSARAAPAARVSTSIAVPDTPEFKLVGCSSSIIRDVQRNPEFQILPNLREIDDARRPPKKEWRCRSSRRTRTPSLDWRDQYKYIEDIDDGRGYTGGIVATSCSGTGTCCTLSNTTQRRLTTSLPRISPLLRAVNGTDSRDGLDPTFVPDWRNYSGRSLFQRAQDHERDDVYFNPAVSQGKSDGLGTLGQFIYHDALVMHGPGDDSHSFGGILTTAMENASTPAQQGDEVTYLNAFLDARRAVMLTSPTTPRILTGSTPSSVCGWNRENSI